MTPLNPQAETTLKALFEAAVKAALPQYCVANFLPPKPQGKIVVVGMGKAAAAMAHAVEMAWGERLQGLVVTRYGHSLPTQSIEVVEAAHPLPDRKGIAATKRIFEQVQGLSPDDLVLCLISGGGSALFTLPPEGLTLTDLADVNRQLLKSGADIREMNIVRKNLSDSSGGRLAAAAYPAQVVSLIISDVPGDDLRAIASGPTVGDEATAQDALAILRKYSIQASPHILDYLERDPNPVIRPDALELQTTRNVLVATPQKSLEAAAQVARDCGYAPLILGDSIEGEAQEVGIVHAGIAKQVLTHGQPLPAPCVILSGGETTVTVRGKGKGGRNSTFLLSVAIALNGLPKVYALACDTDGIDGSEDNAGAYITPDTLQLGLAKGLNAADFLANNDSYSFFAALDQLIETGPTLTNVNDFRAIIISN